jgi:hypothetical protein
MLNLRAFHRSRAFLVVISDVINMLKCQDGRKNQVVGTQATYPCGSSTARDRVYEQRHAAQRVLPESGFELRHAGSASEEPTLEEYSYSQVAETSLESARKGDRSLNQKLSFGLV